MRSYKELKVWDRSMNLVMFTYKLLKKFPESEKFVLNQQIQRAVISIPANIAEGWGRNSTKEYVHFLKIARGSLYELETYFIISQRLKYITISELENLQKEIKSIGKMLNRLITKLKND